MKRDVTYYIRRLLYRYDCVIIPDLGGFVGSYQSAQILTAIQTIKPPYKKISFNIHLNGNDGLLANEIAHEEEIDFEVALKAVQNFVQDCLERLAAGDNVRLEHIGDLFYDSEQNLQYRALYDTNYLKSSFGLSSMRLESVEKKPIKTVQKSAPKAVKEIVQEKSKEVVQEVILEKERTGINWKVAAVLIPIIGLLSLGYFERAELSGYYYQYSKIGSFFFDREQQYEERESDSSIQENELDESSWFDALSEEEIIDPSPEELITDTEEISDEVIIEKESSEISETEIAKETDKATPNELAGEDIPLKYHVVAGCFGEAQNATKLSSKLNGEGYSGAKILDHKHKGLSVVVYNSFASREEAAIELKEVQKSVQADAWLLKK